MSDDNVLPFNREWAGPVTPDAALESCRGKLDSVIIIGREKDGVTAYACSNQTVGAILFEIELFKAQLLSGRLGS